MGEVSYPLSADKEVGLPATSLGCWKNWCQDTYSTVHPFSSGERNSSFQPLWMRATVDGNMRGIGEGLKDGWRRRIEETSRVREVVAPQALIHELKRLKSARTKRAWARHTIVWMRYQIQKVIAPWLSLILNSGTMASRWLHCRIGSQEGKEIVSLCYLAGRTCLRTSAFLLVATQCWTKR